MAARVLFGIADTAVSHGDTTLNAFTEKRTQQREDGFLASSVMNINSHLICNCFVSRSFRCEDGESQLIPARTLRWRASPPVRCTTFTKVTLNSAEDHRKQPPLVCKHRKWASMWKTNGNQSHFVRLSASSLKVSVATFQGLHFLL